MQRVYVTDWLPARKVADRSVIPAGPSLSRASVNGVGALTPVVALKGKGTKAHAKNLSLPAIRNGPLSQRAEKTKSSLRAGGGVRGLYGVSGSSSQAMYIQAINSAKQQVVDAVTASQPALDKVDSTLIGIDSQLQSLSDAAGPSAPNDVLAVISDASSARRDFGDMVDSIKATIDTMNQAAANVPPGANISNFGVGTPGQVALDKARQQAAALAQQVTSIQRAASALVSRVEAATQKVNRYVDQLNAQAAVLVQQQAQNAQATDIAYQLTDQQKQLQAAQAYQQQQIAQQQADQQAQLAQAQQQAQQQYQAQLAQQQQQYQQVLQQLMAAQQQQQYQAPQYSPPPPPPSYNYAPTYQAPQYSDPNYAPYAPQNANASLAYAQDDAVYYQTPQYGMETDGGPSAAGSEWATYVEGMRGVGAVVPQGAAPSGSALAQAQARQIVAQANLKLKDARNQIQQQNAAAAPVPAPVSKYATLEKVGIGAALVYAGLKVASYIGGKR